MGKGLFANAANAVGKTLVVQFLQRSASIKGTSTNLGTLRWKLKNNVGKVLPVQKGFGQDLRDVGRNLGAGSGGRPTHVGFVFGRSIGAGDVFYVFWYWQ